MGRICGGSAHTPLPLERPAGRNFYLQHSLLVVIVPPLNFLFSSVERGLSFSSCGMCARGSPWQHVLHCSSFFLPNKFFLVTDYLVYFCLQLTKARNKQFSTVISSYILHTASHCNFLFQNLFRILHRERHVPGGNLESMKNTLRSSGSARDIFLRHLMI